MKKTKPKKKLHAFRKNSNSLYCLIYFLTKYYYYFNNTCTAPQIVIEQTGTHVFLRYIYVTFIRCSSPCLSLSKNKCPSEISGSTFLSHTPLFSQCPRHNKNVFCRTGSSLPSNVFCNHHTVPLDSYLHSNTATRLCPL